MYSIVEHAATPLVYSMLLVMDTTTPRTTRSDVVDAATRGGDVGSDRYHASYSVLRTLLVVVLLVVLVVYCSCPVVCCAPLVLLLIVLWDDVLTTCPRYNEVTHSISIPIFGPTRIVWCYLSLIPERSLLLTYPKYIRGTYVYGHGVCYSSLDHCSYRATRYLS